MFTVKLHCNAREARKKIPSTIPSLSTMAAPRVSRLPLKVVSFNMHGFHQGQSVVDDLAKHSKPDLFLLQEHWLTPANLYLFDNYFDNIIFQWVILQCLSALVRVCFAVALLVVLLS